MKKLITFFYKNGKYKIALPVLAVGFTLQTILIVSYLPEFLHYSGNIKNPDQLFTYDLEYIKELYQKLGEVGRKFYLKMLGVDFLYTTITGVGYSLLLSTLIKKEKWYIIIPLLLMLSDIFENISQIILLNNFPNISSTGVALSSTFSSVKMTGGAISLLLILFFIGKNIVDWAKNKRMKV